MIFLGLWVLIKCLSNLEKPPITLVFSLVENLINSYTSFSALLLVIFLRFPNVNMLTNSSL